MSTEINFASDNAAPAHPAIMRALQEENNGPAMGYGNDATTARMENRFRALFDCELRAFPVATGTAANVLALATLTPPFGSIYCHKNSHIQEDECGAPEFFTHGAKLALLDGEDGKISPEDLKLALLQSGSGVVHHVPHAALSLTQVTEGGTVYTGDEISALSKVAQEFDLGVHMDGARFANAVATLNCHAADITWKAGVDVLSFGGTKNGAMSVEAVIFFDLEKAAEFEFRRKRGAHLFSKSRYLSAQLDRLIQDDLWIDLASNANVMAKRLADGLQKLGQPLLRPVQANILFTRLDAKSISKAKDAGFLFYVMGEGEGAPVRLVTSWNTTETDVDQFLSCIG